MNRTLPSFLVIGAARSGTTGLVEGLRTHPRVFVTDPKEPHYFALHGRGAHFTAPGDDHTINKVAVTDRDAYLDLYPQRHDYLALGDASVSTLYYHREALPEVARMNPTMRLVVMLREPVARAYSSHQYMRARGLEPEPDFLAAVALEPERRERGWHHIWHYTEMSRYAEALTAVYDLFPRDQVGVWFHDELEADYVGTVSSILRFLGVPSVEGEATGVPRVNVSGQPRYAPVHRAIAWATGHERIRSVVKARTSYRFRERVRRAVLHSDPIPGEARGVLTQVFEEDLVRLRAVLRDAGSGPRALPGWLERGA
jgi:hypothetical protein